MSPEPTTGPSPLETVVKPLIQRYLIPREGDAPALSAFHDEFLTLDHEIKQLTIDALFNITANFADTTPIGRTASVYLASAASIYIRDKDANEDIVSKEVKLFEVFSKEARKLWDKTKLVASDLRPRLDKESPASLILDASAILAPFIGDETLQRGVMMEVEKLEKLWFHTDDIAFMKGRISQLRKVSEASAVRVRRSKRLLQAVSWSETEDIIDMREYENMTFAEIASETGHDLRAVIDLFRLDRSKKRKP